MTFGLVSFEGGKPCLEGVRSGRASLFNRWLEEAREAKIRRFTKLYDIPVHDSFNFLAWILE
jgi:hypothetical protein